MRFRGGASVRFPSEVRFASALVYSQTPFTDVQSGAMRVVVVVASARIGTSSPAMAKRDDANVEEMTRPGMPFQ